MKMLLPPRKTCRAVDAALKQYFVLLKPKFFNSALKLMSKFYEVKVLKVEWYEYLDNGKTWGKTWTDGAIHLIDPKIWESRGRSIEQWIDTFHHEFWHYLTFVEEEEKADEFALKIKERAG